MKVVMLWPIDGWNGPFNTSFVRTALPAMGKLKARFSIDRGGTFTDVYAEKFELQDDAQKNGDAALQSADGVKVLQRRVLKLLSEDPSNYDDAPREGIRRYPRSEPLPWEHIDFIRMGTTVATNALLERKGERFALLTTQGFRDIWHIGSQARPQLFDLEIKCPENLYDEVIEIEERVLLGSEDLLKLPKVDSGRIQEAVTGEKVYVEQELQEAVVRAALEDIKRKGIKSVAVVFMHAALYPAHEQLVGRIAAEMGCFRQVSLSHEVMQMVKIVPRGYTTFADAYLTPHIARYIETFVSGFAPGLLEGVNVSFMQSDGGLTPVDRFSGHKAILSGPAGGVVGYALTTRLATRLGPDDPLRGDQVVGFDMGGTSTDVSRYAGAYEHVFETTTAGVTIQAPQLDISTVAAGGGSELRYKSGIFSVGPESVGAHPGPVCYRKGGRLAVTDANVALGRLIPDHFPKIFGPKEDESLDAQASKNMFEVLAKEVAKDTPPEMPEKSAAEVAFGFIQVANEAMCRPIRNLTQMRGYDITKHVLACFGGAGGQHACAIARALGMRKVFIHRYSGILSAYGIGLADVVQDVQEPCALEIPASLVGAAAAAPGGDADGEEKKTDPDSDLSAAQQQVDAVLDRVQAAASDTLVKQGFSTQDILCERFLNMRFVGTDTALMVRGSSAALHSYIDCFLDMYSREFGFVLKNRAISIDDARVRASGRSGARADQDDEFERSKASASAMQQAGTPLERRQVYFADGWCDTPVYKLDAILERTLKGPAIIIDPNSTIVVEPHCLVSVSVFGDVTVDLLQPEEAADVDASEVERADPIQLALFSHRFMGIAEQMGRTLQRTSVSVNVKERLDFSCALFGPDGGLVANAPHIPVHLGAMSAAIRFQQSYYANGAHGGIEKGDVLVSNHPQLAGGSHLPDITVITPCFSDEGELVFWVASRGHHADVGGITPGSMPPHSKQLADEGAAIVTFKLVRGGAFQEEGIAKILSAPSNPSDPDCSGTRALADNLSDLRAQVAANNHGVRLVRDLIKECGHTKVIAYMTHIQKNAERAVRDMLKDFVKRKGTARVQTVDYMDDGTPIQVAIEIDPATGSATFDFAGTGPQVLGNCNAPPAVTYSAIIFTLRCLVGQTIPLNQGCLQPVTIKIPSFTILNPSETSAVVGGNVLTSQRVVDVIFRAFEACAASQGCMNNFTFGDEKFGYYETIAGGAGAGPTWDGRSGVHTAMTNTRITDPEILEKRFPVVLRRFSLREGSGGLGKHRGGDGVIREVEFLRPMTVSILSERRARAPFGMAGGQDALCGQNLLVTRDETSGKEILQNLGGKASVKASPGQRIRILTPGGGGYGLPKRPLTDPSGQPDEEQSHDDASAKRSKAE
ncbi:5-oxoprolinase [Hondaea fermentalgiana]|uniref:5-oxoprolinase n=1 Tax=Hondaea fermentalgiana TaxID=2315210 RepID=A0A2R5G9Q8_9STRA|nr:5-oxoprolinase [Hondaea fermentalgiana]|eukprot:GBG26458.1 5-oxoprolinase [Hondaea fermentalgiana]